MADIEKVIKALDCLATNESTLLCSECAYYRYSTKKHPGFCNFTQAMRDAISLLKEQEAVKPRVSTVEQRCGNCNKVIEMDGWITCPWCGKPIKWEGR